MKKVAIYCRVSGADQDIRNQQKSLPEYAKDQGWEIFKVYSDDAISGASDNRPAFAELLKDLIADKFNILLVEEHDRISRSGDMAERGMILQTIKKHNVMLWSPSEGKCDLSGFAGEITSNIKLIIAAEERKNIIKRTVRGKKARLADGKCTVSNNQLPYARLYNRETEEWSLDEYKANLIRECAHRYLAGESLRDICDDLYKRGSGIKYVALIRLLKDYCGDTWTIKYDKHPEGLYEASEHKLKIPRILDDETIRAVRDRIEFNKKHPRSGERERYLLNGFLKCAKCGKALSGQLASSVVKGKRYTYKRYRHPVPSRYKDRCCTAFHSIYAHKIEDVVFKTMFQSIYDRVAYEKALKDSMPDAKMIKDLKKSIDIRERKLRKVNRDLDKLVQSYLDGVFTADEIAQRKSALNSNKTLLEADLNNLKDQLRGLPDVKTVEEDAKKIRLSLMDNYKDLDAFLKKSFEHKRQFLFWFFRSERWMPKDHDPSRQVPYGIYLSKEDDVWKITIHGSIHKTVSIQKNGTTRKESFNIQGLTNFAALKYP